MAIFVQGKCGHRIRVGKSFQGRTIVCPECGTMQPIPVPRSFGEKLGIGGGMAGYLFKVALVLFFLGMLSVLIGVLYVMRRF